MDVQLVLLVWNPIQATAITLITSLLLYLYIINQRMRGVPNVMKRLKQKPWTVEKLREAYARLEENPITVENTKDRLPPKLNRRYIMTGGNGLVGGYIVLQLLARGQSPESIRIVDYQAMHRHDMLESSARDIDVVHIDISSVASTEAAFSKPWPASVAKLPLTVFHTAAIMLPLDQSQSIYTSLERVNIDGTRHVLAATRKAGADVLISTGSGTISVRKVGLWMAPWRLFGWPKNFVQHLNEADFFHRLRPRSEFISAFSASKAAAERIVCDANCEHLRTGSIRPSNGIYGHPTDNTIGAPLKCAVFPSWSCTSVNSFVHGMNCALAHLNLEAVLAVPRSSTTPQAGRPFTITDPNAPIQFRDLWLALETLSVTSFRVVPIMPLPMLIASRMVKLYRMLPQAFPTLKRYLPKVTGDPAYLQPAVSTIMPHLYATNEEASKSVAAGGIGYCGVINTMDGVVQQVLDWNNEHVGQHRGARVKYKCSVCLAEVFSDRDDDQGQKLLDDEQGKGC